MNIKFEKETKKPTYFKDLETGTAFTHNNILYIKITKECMDYAVNLYENKVEIIKPDALVHIKEYEITFLKIKKVKDLKPGDTFECISVESNEPRYMKLKPTEEFDFNALNLKDLIPIKISDDIEVWQKDTQIKIKSEHTHNEPCNCCDENDSKCCFEDNPKFIKKSFKNPEEFLDFVIHEILDKKD